MIRRLTAIFCCLWCVLLIRFVWIQWNGGVGGREVISVFSGMGLEETQVYLDMTGELGILSTEKKAVDKLRNSAGVLGISSEMQILEEQKRNGKIWSVQGDCILPELQSNYQANAKMIAIKEGFFTRYYLQIAVKGEANAKQTSIIRERMERIRQREDLECIISVRLDGIWNRILSQEEKQNICEAFVEASGAKITEQNMDDNLMMVYAYGKHIGEAIVMDQQEINLNLLFRDSQNKTRCFVGIPAVWSDDVSVME